MRNKIHEVMFFMIIFIFPQLVLSQEIAIPNDKVMQAKVTAGINVYLAAENKEMIYPEIIQLEVKEQRFVGIIANYRKTIS